MEIRVDPSLSNGSFELVEIIDVIYSYVYAVCESRGLIFVIIQWCRLLKLKNRYQVLLKLLYKYLIRTNRH